MEGEAGGSSSSSCTTTESCCGEGQFYLRFGEANEEWYGESIRRGSESSAAFVEYGGTETFGREESPLEVAGEDDRFAREASASTYDEEDNEMRDSIFAYSAPSQFPDIVWARKSAFGSIFVRTSIRKRRASGYERRTPLDSQFNMMTWHLDSFDKDYDRVTAKSSVFRAFEKRGIAKESSSSYASQWDVFPITTSALFSFHIHDRIHQTRKLSKVEERIANAPVQFLKFTHTWPSGSAWTGHWDGLGMAGTGTYVMPHDVCYFGKMQDGMWHDDDATLVYPNGFKALHCSYLYGELADCQFQFPDNLDHEKENWNYCRYPDRRFWSEIQCGLKPGKLAQRTQDDPPRKITENCYDTNDGFYNPKTKMLLGTDGQLLRVPTCAEEKWIKAHCRKGFRDFTGFRPDLYENWYDNDQELITALLNMKKLYEVGHITYEELYQFYADSGILSTSSPFTKKQRSSELKTVNDNNSPCPLVIGPYRLKKLYEGREHRRKAQPVMPSPNAKKKPPKKCLASKPKRNASSEKMSGKIKFSEGNRTGITSTTNFSETVSKSKRTSDAGKSHPLVTLSSLAVSAEISGESDTSLYQRKLVLEIVNGIISDMVNGIVFAERERHRDRFIRTQTLGNLPFGARDRRERCVQVLEELYRSIPEKEEFCDSVADRASDLKKLAEDRFQSVRYWGKRIFTLSFDEKE